VREAPGTALLDSLVAHLVGACANVAGALLGSCPNLRVLATSREALGVPGEWLYPVPPLSLPDPRRPSETEGLASYEAAKLFLDRARAVRPDFALTEVNAAAVAQICYRLDGMPLAIELAAARARMLSAEQISSRLEGSFALLSGGDRAAVPHHRTLRATMDWSYGLLTGEERVLLRRLSVF
jgi:predicted ATPase